MADGFQVTWYVASLVQHCNHYPLDIHFLLYENSLKINQISILFGKVYIQGICLEMTLIVFWH